MNARIEGTLHAIVSIGIVFVAMVNPIISVAVAFLCLLAVVKMTAPDRASVKS